VAAAETRREILRAARRLFAAHGYAGTSLQQIAEESGVAGEALGRAPPGGYQSQHGYDPDVLAASPHLPV